MRFDFSLPFLVYCMHGRWRREDAGRISAHRFIRQRKQHSVAARWLSRRLFKPRSPARWGLNSYEFSQKCSIRHLMMADISFKQHDFTNMARHIQMACAWDPKNKDMIRYWESQCPALSDVWGYAMTNPWSAVDITSTISKGLSSPFKTPDDSLFLDAVSHDWPAMSSIPQSIMTNLLLCNNILTNNSQGNIASNQLHMRMPCH